MRQPSQRSVGFVLEAAESWELWSAALEGWAKRACVKYALRKPFFFGLRTDCATRGEVVELLRKMFLRRRCDVDALSPSCVWLLSSSDIEEVLESEGKRRAADGWTWGPNLLSRDFPVVSRARYRALLEDLGTPAELAG